MCYRPLADMDFSSARKRRKTFDSRLNAGSSALSVVSSCQPSTSSAGSSASSLVSSCQPSPSSAGSSASSAVSSCQPSTSSAGSSASSVAPTCLATTSSTPAAKTSASATPSASEIDDFYLKLSQCGHKPAVLSLVSPYSQSYVTDVSVNLRPLTSLFKKENITFTLAEL